MRLQHLALLTLCVSTVSAICPNFCSGHGDCSFDRTMQCTCFSGWTGFDCSLRTCATGLAWVGFTETTDGLHTQEVECSNMGNCNRQTGLCDCEDMFEGLACEKMACPNDCSGHGRCLTISDAATTVDGRLLTVDTTYENWDAEKIQGCVCDLHYHGHDCGLRTCPSGDDPLTTGQVDETQVLNCDCDATCSGYFLIKFRGFTSGRINYNAVATIAEEDPDVRTLGVGIGESLEAKLQEIATLNHVNITTVSTSGAVCDPDGAVNTLLFHQNGGDLPEIEVTSYLASTSGVDPVITVDHGGTGASVDGTTEDAECSNRGICDTARGVCNCFTGFGASDGDGGNGSLPDCGAEDSSTPITDCPNSCQGLGDCNTADFTCSCFAGFTGGDCSLRECSYHNAWFDEPFAQDQAHQSALCSNMGRCDYSSGQCTCQNGFTGGACQRLDCPGPESLRPCNQRGRCLSNKELARVGTLNGEFIGEKEVQSVTCHATSGTFTLTHQHSVTNAIAFDATVATVQSELEALVTVGLVTVNFVSPATVACSATPNVMRITFDYDFGDQGLMSAATSSAETITVAEVVKGTRVTYGEIEGNPQTWDADMLHGCLCDGHPNYNATFPAPAGDVGYFIDNACTQRSCPFGHDPLALETAPDPEIQSFTCYLSSGTFTLEFRTEVTEPIAFDATPEEVKIALQSIDSIGLVNVTFIGSVTPCDPSGVVNYVLFETQLGELPLLRAFPSTGDDTDITVEQIQAGNSTSIECAGRGSCDRTLGVCKCTDGYVSGNGFGEKGGRGDCGAQDPLFRASN